MSREIKIRAWDVDEQKMISAEDLAFEEYAPLCQLLKDTDHMKFMQFIGMEDKNGNEIYEGDIVWYEDCVADCEGYHDDIFINQGVIRYGDNGYYVTNKQVVTEDDLIFDQGRFDVEVKGNIYENPELLEVQE